MTTHKYRSFATDERGASALSVLCLILGICSIVLASVVLFVLLLMTFDGVFTTDAGDVVGLVVLVSTALAHLAGGIALVWVARHQNAAGGQAAVPQAAGERVISRQVVAQAPKSEPSLAPIVASTEARASAPSTADAAEEISSLVNRSSDVFATLKDLVRHDAASAQGDRHHLAEMLRATGLMEWDDAPKCEAGRLSRNHHYWIRLGTDGLSELDYDRLIMAEAALSVNQDLPSCAGADLGGAWAPVSDLMCHLADQDIRAYDLSDTLGMAYPNTPADQTPGEWLLRASLSSAAECAVTPFRVVYDLRCNVAAGAVALNVEVPRPRCMTIFDPDERSQAAIARAYALRLSALLATQAFAISQKVTQVFVSCHEHGSESACLAVAFTRELLERLRPFLATAPMNDNGFPSDEGIRASFDEVGWLTAVEPFVRLDDELVSPHERFRYPELVDRAVSPRLTELSGARKVSDLGINENAGRIAAWDQLSQTPWTSTEEAVAALVELRGTTSDITVAEACNRTADALVAGSIDASDAEGLSRLFIRGTSLERAVTRGEAALDESKGPDNPEEAARVLSEALAPIEAIGAYLDDQDSIYRYFGSVAERICFELELNDHTREVRLVPDAYFNALSNLSIAYDELGRTDDAMRYAEEMMRIAPASVHAALRKVRVLEHQSRIFEAADLIKAILHLARTPRDAAVCHYRLAYMQWKLGREDLAVACYQRALTWDTEVSQQAREELDDLLAASEGLRRLSNDEAASLLAREGIPLGCTDADRRRMAATAALCADEGIFWPARALVGLLFGFEGDDVMMGVYRSLSFSS